MHRTRLGSLGSLLTILLTLTSACATSSAPAGHPPKTSTRLVAILPMKNGYGPSDHDAYEARIAPTTGSHGMTADTMYTVTKYLGGSGPREASSVGVWALETPASLEAVMSDPRYQAEVPLRDRIHDMSQTEMFVAQEEPAGVSPEPGHVLLVGAIAMNPGFGFQDHAEYEASLARITARHGMRLSRSFRVLKAMGGAANVVAVNVWDLASPGSLEQVMADPEYVAKVEHRNRIHDMAATTMYFVTQRGGAR